MQNESRRTVEVLKRIESLLLKSGYSSMRERLSEMDKKNDARFDAMDKQNNKRFDELKKQQVSTNNRIETGFESIRSGLRVDLEGYAAKWLSMHLRLQDVKLNQKFSDPDRFVHPNLRSTCSR